MSVAVVIPVWDDYVRYLAEAVASIEGAAQIVVVDNASTIAVPQIAGTTVIRSPQRVSTGAARNRGLEAVSEPLVVFLDADDLLLPGALAALAAGLDDDHVAYCLTLVEGDSGRRHRSPRGLARRLAARPRAFAFATSIWSLLPTQGATIMRTADVRDAGGYADRSQGEDWALAVSLAWRGRVGFGDDAALVYRWREQASTRAVLLDSARCVRERVQAGRALVAPLQWLAITVVRPAWRGLRALRPGRGSRARPAR